ncbi:ATP-grasp domain-containing protein [Sporosarcina sp. FSL K6-1508]|uniref:ATP-grasp domain-containing protein n=1 Tax=Sporosarcina sp. FSL K6-1508 TaxID=2921553 RepID=UPI0030FB4EA2
MSILILNRFSDNSAKYYEWLKDLNEPIVMLCDEVRRDLIDTRYDEQYYFSNWRTNGNLESIAIELHSKYNFKRIISFSETDLIRAAMLRELLGVHGQNVKSAKAFRDKVFMKQILKEKGIRVPKFKKVEHPADLLNFCTENGFPVVYKPVDGAGSENTEILYTWEDVKHALISTAFKPFQVEEFIEGDMYHIDGLWNNEKIEFLVASKYINGCLAYKEDKYLGSFILDEDNILHNRLLKYTSEVMEALPSPPACPIHAEVFVTPEGKLYLCEIASRAGGARVVETINRLFNFHILKEATLAQCSINYIQKEKKRSHLNSAGWALVPPKNGMLKKMPASIEHEKVIEFLCNAKVGDRFNNASKSVDHILSVIVCGQNENEVEKNINESVSWLNENTLWESVENI